MLVLFAKAANLNNDDDLTDEEAGILCIVYLVLFLVEFFLSFFLAMAASRALGHCRPRKRTMEPGQAWLNLIPLFHLVWQFITVIRVAESLRKEFRSRGLAKREEDFGKGLGITMCVMRIITCTWPISIICYIIYCVKLSGYSKRLALDDERSDDSDDDDHRHTEEDDEDDRPRKRRGDEDDDYDDRPRNRR